MRLRRWFKKWRRDRPAPAPDSRSTGVRRTGSGGENARNSIGPESLRPDLAEPATELAARDWAGPDPSLRSSAGSCCERWMGYKRRCPWAFPILFGGHVLRSFHAWRPVRSRANRRRRFGRTPQLCRTRARHGAHASRRSGRRTLRSSCVGWQICRASARWTGPRGRRPSTRRSAWTSSSSATSPWRAGCWSGPRAGCRVGRPARTARHLAGRIGRRADPRSAVRGAGHGPRAGALPRPADTTEAGRDQRAHRRYAHLRALDHDVAGVVPRCRQPHVPIHVGIGPLLVGGAALRVEDEPAGRKRRRPRTGARVDHRTRRMRSSHVGFGSSGGMKLMTPMAERIRGKFA